MGNQGKTYWTDPERIQSLVDSYNIRYGAPFWDTLLKLTNNAVRHTIADFGCGPGLFLNDTVDKFNAKTVYGFDASQEMLQQAIAFLEKRLPSNRRYLELVDFDIAPIPLPDRSVDLAFSGYVLHEIENPIGLADQVLDLLRVSGAYAVLDLVSTNVDEFVTAMTSVGMKEERARERFPNMCKHSLEDIKSLLTNAGFHDIKATKLDAVRGLVVGFKSSNEERSERDIKRQSPWVQDDSKLTCPRCNGSKIDRVLDSWGRSRGVQMFECATCGKKFYERGIDDFRPTFVR